MHVSTFRIIYVSTFRIISRLFATILPESSAAAGSMTARNLDVGSLTQTPAPRKYSAD